MSVEEIALLNPRTNKMCVHIGLVLWPFVYAFLVLMPLANLHLLIFKSRPLAGCIPLHEPLISDGNIVFHILLHASLIYGHIFFRNTSRA